MELLAEGRMAEVFALDDGRVVKLDRPEWSGVSHYESDVITRLSEAGLPVARSHGVVTIDGRCGVVLDRVAGRSLRAELGLMEATGGAVDDLAERFCTLQATINATSVAGLPDLVLRLAGELAQSGLEPGLVAELTDLLTRLDDGQRGVCHFDFNLDNVLSGATGWVVIDWLTVASGPPLADLARTLVLIGQLTDPPIPEFIRAVRRHGLQKRKADVDTCAAWVRVAAGARRAEGFEGEYADWLRSVAEGATSLFK